MGRCDRGVAVTVTSTGQYPERGIIDTDAPPSHQEGIDRRPVLSLWIARYVDWHATAENLLKTNRSLRPSGAGRTDEVGNDAPNVFGGKQSPSQQSRLRPVRRNWSDVKCFFMWKNG